MSDTAKLDPAGDQHPFGISRFSGDGNGSCVSFRVLGNEDVELEDDKISEADRHLTRQRYDRAEMVAFLKAGASGDVVDWTPEELRELIVIAEAALAARTAEAVPAS
jgi:hypothetical protein